MLLKPATPLTILLLAAFVLLLLSVLSTPIIKGIPLATFNHVDYGVFGFCKAGQCTDIHIGYTTGMWFRPYSSRLAATAADILQTKFQTPTIASSIYHRVLEGPYPPF
jgi:hypothetical protein